MANTVLEVRCHIPDTAHTASIQLGMTTKSPSEWGGGQVVVVGETMNGEGQWAVQQFE